MDTAKAPNQEEIPGPPRRDSTGRSQCRLKGRRLKEAAGKEDREGREQSPNTDEHLFTVSSTMEIIFGRNKKEQLEPVRARVTGKIPAWLQGTLLRNGPGMHTVGETRYNHWFDGLALLHSFTIRDGEVYYRSKYLRSDTYTANIEANRIVVSEFGTMAYPDPCKNIFSK